VSEVRIFILHDMHTNFSTQMHNNYSKQTVHKMHFIQNFSSVMERHHSSTFATAITAGVTCIWRLKLGASSQRREPGLYMNGTYDLLVFPIQSAMRVAIGWRTGVWFLEWRWLLPFRSYPDRNWG